MKPLVFIADGGHAEVLIGMAELLGHAVAGMTSLNRPAGETVAGVRVLGDDSVVSDFRPDEVVLVNAVGSVDVPRRREEVFERFRAQGYCIASLVHPTALIAKGVQLAEGVQIMAGAVVQVGCVIGRNCIVNTGVILDHHCEVGSHSHIAPGVTCSGGVKIGKSCHVGAGATVIQDVCIEDEVLIAAGAVVTGDLFRGQRVRGVPARPF